MIRGENFDALQFAGGRVAEAIRERAAAVNIELPALDAGCLMLVAGIIEVSHGALLKKFFEAFASGSRNKNFGILIPA